MCSRHWDVLSAFWICVPSVLRENEKRRKPDKWRNLWIKRTSCPVWTPGWKAGLRQNGSLKTETCCKTTKVGFYDCSDQLHFTEPPESLQVHSFFHSNQNLGHFFWIKFAVSQDFYTQRPWQHFRFYHRGWVQCTEYSGQTVYFQVPSAIW